MRDHPTLGLGAGALKAAFRTLLASALLTATTLALQGPGRPNPGANAAPKPANPAAPANPTPANPGPGAQDGGKAGGKVDPIQEDDQYYYLNFDETAGADGLTLEGFVKICQDATDINFTYAQDTAGLLNKLPLRMFGPKKIPKSDFYQFFQIMMIINEFVCTKIGPDHLSVVLIQSLQGQARTNVRNGAVYVKPDELDRYADQPAVLITTVLDLPHTDVRNLSNSMRQMFTDANTQQIIPVGNSNSLIITGFGSNVAAIVKMLRFVDEASANQATINPLFEVLPLEFASAEELADTLTDLLEASRRSAQARGTQVQAAVGATGNLQVGQSESKIMVDPRTNSLLVMAMPEDMPRIKELIARLDVDVVQGERTYHIYALDNVDAEELSKTLEDFIKDASRVQPGAAGGGARGGQPQATSATSAQRNEVVVVPDKATNSLLIAANRSRYDEVLQLIQRLDQRQEQVLIETALVELSGQDSFDLGVELGGLDNPGSGTGSFGVTSFGLSDFVTNPTGAESRIPRVLSGVTAGILKGEDFDLPILLNALKTRRDTNVLNVPSVLVNNNKSAKVTSKDQQPTTTITATGGVGGQTQENFKEYVEAGITMEISPTISASHYLRLSCSLEVSNFLGAVSGAIPPPKTTRTIQTTVNVPDGDTMVIGGIITDTKGSSRNSVPFLGDIPFVGALFRSDSDSGSKTTLYFFVTPHIMRDTDFRDLYEYSYHRKLAAAESIGASRIMVVDPKFGKHDSKSGLDFSGFDTPSYRGPERGEVQGNSVGLDASKVKGLLKPGEAQPNGDKP